MISNMYTRNLLFYLLVGCLMLVPMPSSGADPAKALSLKETIDSALEANLGLKRSQEEVRAAGIQKIAHNRVSADAQFILRLPASK